MMIIKKIKELYQSFLELLSSSFKRIIPKIIYTGILGIIIYLFIILASGTNVALLLKDLAIKKLGIDTSSYLGRKIDEELYAITPYGIFDRNKMIEKTDNYINYFHIGIVDREFEDISKYISEENLYTYKKFYLDLKQFHTDLVFNIYNYNKDIALKDLYKIILKYKCSMEKANQNLFTSDAPKSMKDKFIKEKLSDKIDDLLVETIIYTKSISISEINDYKAKNKLNTNRDLWHKMLFNYSIELSMILRGDLCYDNYIDKKTKTINLN